MFASRRLLLPVPWISSILVILESVACPIVLVACCTGLVVRVISKILFLVASPVREPYKLPHGNHCYSIFLRTFRVITSPLTTSCTNARRTSFSWTHFLIFLFFSHVRVQARLHCSGPRKRFSCKQGYRAFLFPTVERPSCLTSSKHSSSPALFATVRVPLNTPSLMAWLNVLSVRLRHCVSNVRHQRISSTPSLSSKIPRGVIANSPRLKFSWGAVNARLPIRALAPSAVTGLIITSSFVPANDWRNASMALPSQCPPLIYPALACSSVIFSLDPLMLPLWASVTLHAPTEYSCHLAPLQSVTIVSCFPLTGTRQPLCCQPVRRPAVRASPRTHRYHTWWFRHLLTRLLSARPQRRHRRVRRRR